MKTLTFYSLLFWAASFSLYSCKNTESSPKLSENNTNLSDIDLQLKLDKEKLNIYALESKFPIILETLDIQDSSKFISLNDEKVARIEKIIQKYYFEECGGDSTEIYPSMKDVYIATLQLPVLEANLVLYWIILNRQQPNYVESQVLFFDNKTKEFLPIIYHHNIFSLYDSENKTIFASNLKTHFNIRNPEIDISDFNKDGLTDYKFMRLYHNGTSNAIEETVVQINETKTGFDTLKFNRISIYQNEVFLQYFEEANKQSKPIKLSTGLFQKHFKIDFTPDLDAQEIHAVDYLKTKQNQTLLLYSIECNAGGFCTKYFMAVATILNGKQTIVDNQLVGMEAGDLYEKQIFDYSFDNPNKITIVESLTIVDEKENILEKNKEEWVIEIDNEGKISKVKI